MIDARPAPDVDYLTRDYEGFRQLLISLLDRSDTPWGERAAADVGVMLVEVLAHQLDLLSYAGDRVAEEAFLSTARRRESVRRHAALGDHDLDRGNVTQGLQQFKLKPETAKHLPAGTRVAPELLPGQDPERRLVAETMEDADLDARRNDLRLERAAGTGSMWLRLLAADRSHVDLRVIGLRPGMRLVIIDCDDSGEEITVARVQGGAIELADPLQRTYVTGSAGAPTRVLGNLVPVRRGRRSEWEPCGRGGVALGEVAASVFFARRIDQVRRLRDEAEKARSTWGSDRSLAGWWELANATVAVVVRQLRETEPSTLDADGLKKLDEELWSAADLFRQLLKASGRSVPDELQPGRRVTLPRQKIALSSEQPPLWLDDVEMLSVRIGVAGRWSAWSRVEDFLQSKADDRHYVVEMDQDGQVTLLFGDGVSGALLPADSQVMVRRVTGDLFGGDLGEHSLKVILGVAADDFDLEEPTTNPRPTTGARKPERLADVAPRIRRELSTPAIPVTAADYVTLLLKHRSDKDSSDVAEAVARVVRGRLNIAQQPGISQSALVAAKARVDVVLRPKPDKDAVRVLRSVSAFLQKERLAGTDVWVRLAEPLFVSMTLVIEIHPEIPSADLRLRLRRALLDLFGAEGARLLGAPRTRAEVYRVVESVAGVVWSQVIGFDRARHLRPALKEQIVPEPHQIIRCLDLPGVPVNGAIVIWVARRYRLQIELAYPDPDDRPDIEGLLGSLMAELSGPDSRPVVDKPRWTEITASAVNTVLKKVPAPGARYRLSVLSLMVGQSAVERVALLAGELPILDDIQIRERLFMPHYRLQIDLEYAAIADVEQAFPGPGDTLNDRVVAELRKLLSGPDAVPVQQHWREITVPTLNTLLAAQWPSSLGLRLSVISLMAGTRGVNRVPLRPGEVPILDEAHIVWRGL